MARLEKAYQERDVRLAQLSDPVWDPLARRADFVDLLRRMGIPSPGGGATPR